MDSQTPTSRGNLWDAVRDWVAGHPRWTLALAVFVSLGPFLGKPFNMDDPLFVWTARQIQAHPLDPYGFNVNWYGFTEPMWRVTQNPPLASYYLAAAAGIFGWSEIAAHVAFLFPALAAILGTYRLARRFCDQPLVAALATLFTPVFLVSSTTVMCDVLMLALWVWAVVWWVEGLERDAFWPMMVAGVLILLAAMAKYFGACLVPLLVVYAVMTKGRFRYWGGALLIPVLGLCACQWAAFSLYHQDLLWNAVYYASHKSGFFTGTQMDAVMISVAFTGGGLATVLFLAPWWRWRARPALLLVGTVLALTLALFSDKSFCQAYRWVQAGPRFWLEGQFAFWAISGAAVLGLAECDWRKHRDASSCLLALWVFGTFLFTAAFNWSVNGRSILPMAPAVGILLARQLQKRHAAIPLVLGALFALVMAGADFQFATAARECAAQTFQRYQREGRSIWFQGHWGYQYYMTELGGRPFDKRRPGFRNGDILAVPLNNTNLDPPTAPRDVFYVNGPRFLAVMNLYVGAGFYGSLDGPLPFVFGHVPPENVAIYTWKTEPSGKQ